MTVVIDNTSGARVRHPEKQKNADTPLLRKPSWIRAKAPGSPIYAETKAIVKENGLVTVCEEAACPNIGECWNGGTGTIMLLGDTCTRGCMFCAVNTDSKPPEPDPFEPFKVLYFVHCIVQAISSIFVHA